MPANMHNLHMHVKHENALGAILPDLAET